MIGTKYEKEFFVPSEYRQGALWCNDNNCHIEDKGTYYEIVANESSVLTKEQLIATFTVIVQKHLDTIAQSRNYDSIFTLCSYANEFEPNPKFQQEGKAAVLWRSAVWTKCYEILADIQAGTRGVPDDIITELPEMNWGETV